VRIALTVGDAQVDAVVERLAAAGRQAASA